MQINFERRKTQILLFTISKQQEYKYKSAEFQENPSKLCYLKIPRGRKRNARKKQKKKQPKWHLEYFQLKATTENNWKIT